MYVQSHGDIARRQRLAERGGERRSYWCNRNGRRYSKIEPRRRRARDNRRFGRRGTNSSTGGAGSKGIGEGSCTVGGGRLTDAPVGSALRGV